MGYIKKAGAVLEAREITRPVTLLPADKDLKLPEAKVTIKYMTEDSMRQLAEPFKDENDGINITRNPEFKSKLAVAAVVGLEGWVAGNIRRACLEALKHPELLEGLPEEGIVFDSNDKSDLDWLFRNMEGSIFYPVFFGVQDLQQFAAAELKKEKNE